MLPKQEYVGVLIGAARRRVKQSITARAAPHNLSSLQFWILVVLHDNPCLSLGELAERQRMEMPNTSRVVASLVKRRMIKLKRDPNDRRKAQLELTAAGTAMARKLQKAADDVRSAVTSGMTPEEVESLRGLLRRVLVNLDELDAAAPAAR
jgi:DNA-binding MarR family transcriptional regulator